MAPKRGRKKVAQVVKTTKVVEETVEVSILGTQSQDDVDIDQAQAQAQAQFQTPTKVSERREEQSTITTKNIPIEDEDEAEETETQEPDEPLEGPNNVDKIGTPPRDEGRPKQEEKSPKEAQEKKRPKKRGRRMKEVGEGREGYKSYVYKVLKQVHPGMGVSSKAMTVINNLMADMFERLAGEAAKLGVHAKRNTLSAREIQGAVRLVLPGELGKHAVAEGTKAVTNYMNYGKSPKK
ncbi:hypothetical protein vseg_015393 [Gypsophila vaccaria]